MKPSQSKIDNDIEINGYFINFILTPHPNPLPASGERELDLVLFPLPACGERVGVRGYFNVSPQLKNALPLLALQVASLQ